MLRFVAAAPTPRRGNEAVPEPCRGTTERTCSLQLLLQKPAPTHTLTPNRAPHPESALPNAALQNKSTWQSGIIGMSVISVCHVHADIAKKSWRNEQNRLQIRRFSLI